jgi:hypothetical protein
MIVLLLRRGLTVAALRHIKNRTHLSVQRLSSVLVQPSNLPRSNAAKSPMTAMTQSSTECAAPAVAINHLDFTYPACASTLQDVSLTLPRGSRCLLIGANGAGGRTTIYALSVRICSSLIRDRALQARPHCCSCWLASTWSAATLWWCWVNRHFMIWCALVQRNNNVLWTGPVCAIESSNSMRTLRLRCSRSTCHVAHRAQELVRSWRLYQHCIVMWYPVDAHMAWKHSVPGAPTIGMPQALGQDGQC